MKNAILTLRRETLASPVGIVVILTDEQGRLRAVDFEDYTPRMTRLLNRHYGEGGWAIGNATPSPSAGFTALTAYLAGDMSALDGLETATGGTAFQREVWAALRQCPVGTTESYKSLATRIGRPAAMRAVGMANGANPVAIVTPCHRVIGADGSLTGYGGGLERKQWLLNHEAAHVPAKGV